MKKSVAGRLALLISHLGIKKIDFSRKIKFSQSYVTMVLNGSKPNPSDRFLEAVCREFNACFEWLKDGKGEMFSVPGLAASSVDTEIIAKLRLLPPAEQQMIEGMINTLVVKAVGEGKQRTEKRERAPTVRRTKKK